MFVVCHALAPVEHFSARHFSAEALLPKQKNGGQKNMRTATPKSSS
jgi:hypothetical protein